MRLELREVVKRLKVTTLFVTHEQIEALTMSDVMAVMKDGLIIQEGPPADIYARPAESFVADFIGKTNMLSGRVLAIDANGGRPLATVETGIGTLVCFTDRAVGVGDRLTLAVRPENIALVGQGPPASNVLAGSVEALVFLGNLLECVVAVGQERIRVQLHPSAAPRRGASVQIHLPVEHCLAMRE